MRTYLLAYLFPILFFLPFSLMAQTPQGINYQAVARDNTGSLIANQNIDVRFTILQTGNPVFEEVHNIITNDYGLFTLIIGNGIVTNGDFSAIDWANGVHQLNVEMDAGAGFVNMGTSQLVSVPYSLLAQKVETIDLNLADINDVGNNSPSSGDVLKWNGTAWVPSDDANTTYNAGAGLNLSGTIFSNTGDLDGSDDITNSTAAGGDLSGTFPNPSVSGLNGNPISAVSPSVDDVLKWNGSSWVPSAVSSGSSVWSTGTGGRIYYNSGLVGIGTSTPDAGLEIDINGSLSEPQLLLHEAGNDYARL
ncbi:MAG: hypothetical protein KDD63_09485, partial [Bacteroidetes bacterium]|nr:hypothetical protein [Bacteroidota bacterium]